MSIYYKHLLGWFDFEDIYTEAVNKPQENDIHDLIGEGIQKALIEFCQKNGIKQVYQRNASWLLYKSI